MGERRQLIAGIIAGVLVASIIIALLIGSGGGSKKSHNKEDKLYHNIELKIVSINGDTVVREITHPQECNFILFETMGDEKSYMELNTCNLKSGCGCNKIHIDRKWVYSHRPGDVVHFDYILKERFFKGHKNEQ